MKKILFLISAVLITGSAFAQKKELSNTVSEYIGIVNPVHGDFAEYNDLGTGIGISWQHGSTIDLILSLNYDAFKMEESYIQEYKDDILSDDTYAQENGVTVKGKGISFLNYGVGVAAEPEFGRSGFYFDGKIQGIIGVALPERIDCSMDEYDLQGFGAPQFGTFVGLGMKKMFTESLGLGFTFDQYIGFPGYEEDILI